MQIKNAIALGTFDGVHKGHKAVLNLPYGYKKTAVTFAIPPKAYFSGNRSLITTVEDKIDILKKSGMDEVYLLDFEKVKDMPPEEFLRFLKAKFSPSFISCGFNYRFGKDAGGNIECLSRFCRDNNIVFNCTPPIKCGEKIVSSTAIRGMLRSGDMENANRLLSEPFSFKSEVIDGFKRGRTIGFPTVNQKYPEELTDIRFGVYAAEVLFDSKRLKGITNIGIRPTFKSDYVISETFIKDFSGDLYGKKLRIVPFHFLRDERKFSSLEEVKNQIIKDLEYLDQ